MNAARYGLLWDLPINEEVLKVQTLNTKNLKREHLISPISHVIVLQVVDGGEKVHRGVHSVALLINLFEDCPPTFQRIILPHI